MNTSPFPFDLTGLQLHPGRGLAVQLAQSLRNRITQGELDLQVKLPTTRELALALNISRTTVVRAYDQLYAEGYISARVGDGTYVSAPATALADSMSPAPVLRPHKSQQRLSALGERLAATEKLLPPAGEPRAFRLGVPALDLFPASIWVRLQADFWRHAPTHHIGYSDPAGNPQLRSLLAGYLRNTRGLMCDPDQIIITAGAQQALFMCAQLLLNPGDLAAIENPGYPRVASALTLVGAQLLGIDVDSDGLMTAQLEQLQQNHDIRLTYVTPSHQYPTGVTMSLARRLELLQWAEQHQSYILEDDYDGEYRYRGAPLALLSSLDRHQRVLYTGTFSKIAFPGLRLGYIVAPPALVNPLVNLRMQYDRHSSVADQAVMAEFIAQGHFLRHVRRMRRASRARRDALCDSWERFKPGGLNLPVIDAGLHCTIRLAAGQNEDELVAKAASAGIEVAGLSRFWLPQERASANAGGLVLGFGAVEPSVINNAVKTLAKAWR
ncbi:GntR family transcriptional regulator/MocR family aminotransferase [Herbaspirillum sp. Sphag1AN]|uniref:MocR-like pyridoxine biosynthesis transcription factor PdxR n=1 Tax=unclassified Herbaspirillum TaxID=2624150 RepID=UPI0016108DC1|nr:MULTISPECIES: PLP-dependent aminotransferase family protein [unclassified Herbaspirillum]MBB3213140.1 GntR family transcriptional regulator/MocR family aminotransferase [Herbaspirillum sp. Sphag1AN]MBB3246337.1 GntR family transcriptional regulator/MocR family aminotransferase [Herbaspirillum sp. Sphag64]